MASFCAEPTSERSKPPKSDMLGVLVRKWLIICAIAMLPKDNTIVIAAMIRFTKHSRSAALTALSQTQVSHASEQRK